MVSKLWRSCALVSMCVSVALVGCIAQPKPLYEWGNYQSMVYEYLKGTGLSPQEQIGKLQEMSQTAAAKGLQVPPGFNAQLGLLYLKAGQPEQAQLAFRAEATQFPESRSYMEFLLVKMAQQQGSN